MVEIEVRAIVDNPTSIKQRLLAKGFVEEPRTEQLDMIFDYTDARMFRSGRKLRIRFEGDSTSLTFKGPFETSTKVSRREEINIAIPRADVAQYSSIFEGLGIPLCFQIPKTRHKFSSKDLIVTFDEWPIIGCLVELEGSQEYVVRMAREIAPGIEFRNFRLKELFSQVERRSQKSLAELQNDYEHIHNVKLGRIDLIVGE